jgi:hypothetical protein
MSMFSACVVHMGGVRQLSHLAWRIAGGSVWKQRQLHASYVQNANWHILTEGELSGLTSDSSNSISIESSLVWCIDLQPVLRDFGIFSTAQIPLIALSHDFGKIIAVIWSKQETVKRKLNRISGDLRDEYGKWRNQIPLDVSTGKCESFEIASMQDVERNYS